AHRGGGDSFATVRGVVADRDGGVERRGWTAHARAARGAVGWPDRAARPVAVVRGVRIHRPGGRAPSGGGPSEPVTGAGSAGDRSDQASPAGVSPPVRRWLARNRAFFWRLPQ